MKFEIKPTGQNKHEIYIDGKKIERVTELSLKMKPLELPTVVLTIYPDEICATLDDSMVHRQKDGNTSYFMSAKT